VQPELFPGVRKSKAAPPWGGVREWAVRMVAALDPWRDRAPVAALQERRELARVRALTVDESIGLGIEAINLRRKLLEAT
jgi:hypothetical protein